MLLALAVGFPTLRLRGPYFALAMLSATTAMLYLTIIYSPITGGQDGLNGVYPIIDSQREYYYLTLLFLVATGLALKLKDVSFEITPARSPACSGRTAAARPRCSTC
jgi:branched-chain amino acid transport system permease protein